MSILRKSVRQNIQKIHSFLLKMKKITKNNKKNQKKSKMVFTKLLFYGKLWEKSKWDSRGDCRKNALL